MSAVPGGGGFPPKNKNSGPGLVGGLQVGFSFKYKISICENCLLVLWRFFMSKMA